MAKKKPNPPKMPFIDNVALDTLVLDPNNARLHPEDNLAAICASLELFGQVEHLIVQRSTNIVISGNGRLTAMRQLGWDTARVMLVDWDDEKSAAYSITANRVAEKAQWDFAKLTAIETALSSKFNLESLGFDEAFMAPIRLGEQPVMGAPLEENNGPKHGKPVQCTAEQREIFNKACEALRRNHGEDVSEGRCLELMAADYLSGAP